MDLRSKCEKHKWDIEELNYICSALDYNCKDFDPTFFTDCRYAYLDHIKTHYYLEKMDEFLLFEAFERGDYIPQQHIRK